MDWQSIQSVVGTIIVSVGGSSVVIYAFSKFLGERLANIIDTACQQKLDKQMEKYKIELENKHHITKEQFNVQFQIYRDLSKSYFQILIKLCAILEEDFYEENSLNFDKKKYEEYSYKNVVVTISTAQNVLYENAPFIPKHIFQKYHELYELMNNQFWLYNDWYCKYINGKIELKDRFNENDKNIYKEVERRLFDINEDVRTYLEGLTVIQ